MRYEFFLTKDGPLTTRSVNAVAVPNGRASIRAFFCFRGGFVTASVLMAVCVLLLAGCSGRYIRTEGEGYRIWYRKYSTGMRTGECSSCHLPAAGDQCVHCNARFVNPYRERDEFDHVEITTDDRYLLGQLTEAMLGEHIRYAAFDKLLRIIREGPPSGGWLLSEAYSHRGLGNHRARAYRHALADYTRAIAFHPESPVAYDGRGHTYTKMRQYDSAIADHTRALELSQGGAVRFRAMIYRSRGLAYGEKGEYDKAIADSTRAIELDPKAAVPYQNRAYFYTETGEHDKALADFALSIELDPKIAATYKNRARLHNKMGQYDKAIADSTQTIKLNPKFAEAYAERAIAYCEKGMLEEARNDVAACKGLNGKPDPKLVERLRQAREDAE